MILGSKVEMVSLAAQAAAANHTMPALTHFSSAIFEEERKNYIYIQTLTCQHLPQPQRRAES